MRGRRLYLKSLTLRGFKSFASSTTLQFEPGITCVVGPNGSGKSNVVDALAWVMGEQGAKSLRGGKMDDVIFAGTSGRAPLGRAEVILTIDNTDGALPIEYAEVTISRTMFRSGGSEYAINGQGCRLLDVQELLSDSGIGREMHVIVGQGQLDSVLQATPEERRGFIEEAAGVLKHRKRKEKALRKLEATEGNLTRVQDLLVELRRQLKPLGRQAEVARQAATVQADLRDAKARLLAVDVADARCTLQRELSDESALRARRAEVETSLHGARADESAITRALAEDAPRLSAAQESWYALSGLRERIAGTAGLAAERVRRAAEDDVDARTGPDPTRLAAEAAAVRAEQREVNSEVHTHQHALEQVVAVRHRAEGAHAAEDRRVSELARAAADRREGLARLHGRLHALRSRAAAADDEIGRLHEAQAEIKARAERAQRDFSVHENQVAGLDAGEGGLDAEYEAAAAVLEDLESRAVKLRAAAQVAEQERGALTARKEALELGLARKDGAGALLQAAEKSAEKSAGQSPGQLGGVLGSVSALLSVRNGYEGAVTAALGAAADAVVVDGVDHAIAALHLLRDDDLGRADLLVAAAGADGGPDAAEAARGVESAVPLGDVLKAPAELRPALSALIGDVLVVDDLDAARTVLASHPDLSAVTRDGDLLGRLRAVGGSSKAPSMLEVQAAVDDATERLAEAGRTCERLRFDLARLDDELAAAQRSADAALAALHESDAAMAALAEQLAHLGGVARSARAEGLRIADAISAAEQARDRDLEGLADLERRVAQADDTPVDEDDGAGLARLGDVASALRADETETRLALRTAEERCRALAARAEQMEQQAAVEQRARTQAAARREQLLREAAAARAVAAAAASTLTRLDRSLAAAATLRAEVEQARAARERQLSTVREGLRGHEAELARLTDSVHRDEVARAEQRLRLEALEQRALDEVGLDADTLVADFGPDNADGFDREEQARRLRAAERTLAQLGRINPLALEEFAALEERHQFLGEQLEDVRKTRRDLLDIISDVDSRVLQVFSEAYADVEREFEAVFARLFPGGEGRLTLTDPGDLLSSGVDVEARPPGKKVKRLSLLSGGERSLVAVAFLVALFKARPSPFYILDEVEAALDDTNLGRLLDIYEELRADSQLLVITHQKRTMGVGDALYGVSMRDDGVSVVISQRLREAASA